MSGVIEGAFIGEYYEDIEDYGQVDHDVVILGDCGVYSNFIPATIWEEYGINSYVRGSAQQLMWQSYYLLEDTLRYETPDVVVLNISSMKFDEPQSEAYNRMTLDGMEWSVSKYNAIKASLTQEESMIDYLFPILRYHSRWDDLTSEDLTYMFELDSVAYNGYFLRVDTLSATSVPEGQILSDYQFGDICYEYLDKMRMLCQENDIEFILIKAPSLYPTWYEEWDQQIIDYATQYDLSYINFNELFDAVGLDFQTDTYDAGLHLNLSGATKLSSYFGEYLSNEVGLENRSTEEELSNMWEEKLEIFYAGIEEQKELYGLE